MSMLMKFRAFANDQTNPVPFLGSAADLEKCCCGGVRDKEELDQCGGCGFFHVHGTGV